MLVRETVYLSQPVTPCYKRTIFQLCYKEIQLELKCQLTQVARKVTFFLGKGRKRVWRKKWASAVPPEVWAGRDTSGLRLKSCLMSWTWGSLDGKPPRTSPSAYRSGAAPAYSLGVSLARVPEQEMWGTRCSWRCYHCSLAFVPSCCLSLELKTCVWQFKEQQDCQTVLKPLTCSRIVRLARSPWRAVPDSLGQHHAPLWAPWTQTLSLGEI